MHKSRIVLLIILLPLFAFTVHKYYLSLTNIEYKKEQEILQITMRIFTDDLQAALNATFNESIELGEVNENVKIDSLLAEYVSNHFSMVIDDLQIKYSFLGKEYENDVVYLYLEIADLKEFRSIGVKNSMLQEQFPDQKNIIKLKVNGIKKTTILTRQKDKDLLKF